MITKSLNLFHFRNIEEADISFSPGVNVLWGRNAQGKTNVLEAIYYFARCKSFRVPSDKAMMRVGAEETALNLLCRSDRAAHDLPLTATIARGGRRTFYRDGAKVGPRELIGSFRAVLFCPEHLDLICGAPADRRAFLDVALGQLIPAYVGALGVYNRTLEARNFLLRQAADGKKIDARQWDVYAEQLADAGAVVVTLRSAYIRRLEAHMIRCFSEMTDGGEVPKLRYITLSDVEGDAADAADDLSILRLADKPNPRYREDIYRQMLNVEGDIAAGTTRCGLQRDELRFTLNVWDAKFFASQGQKRSLALAAKLAEGELSRSIGGEEPVYLLDDVFSELDARRRDYVLTALRDRQVIITSCEPEIVPGHGGSAVRFLHVEGGRITE